MTYYIKDSILPVDEDEMWEFKAHRNFSSDEVPAWHADGTKVRPQYAMHEFYKLKNANRTRQPISRNLCGFLNAGRGGTILIGVLDNGKVVGMGLNALQKDHLLLSLEDALRRFNPRVPNDFVKVAFIPVIDNKEELQDVANANICEPPWDMKRQAHQLRTSSLCWCDIHTMHRFQLGFMPTQYVIEVRIAALHPKLRTPEIAQILNNMMKNYKSPLARLSWPAFTSEDGNLFCRVLNSLIKFTEDEITEFNYCQTMDFLRKELSLMESDDDVKKNRRLQFLLPGVTLNKAYLQSILEHDVKEAMALVAQQDRDNASEPASPSSTDVSNYVPMSDVSFDSIAENGFNPKNSIDPDISVSESDMSNPIFIPNNESLEEADGTNFVPESENNSEDPTMETTEIGNSEADFVPENTSDDLLTIKMNEMSVEPDFVTTSENLMETTFEIPATTITNKDDEEEMVEWDNFATKTPEDMLKSDIATPTSSVAEMDEHELDAVSSVSSDMSEHLSCSLHLVTDGDTDLDLSMLEIRPLSLSPLPSIPSMLLELEPRPKSANN